MARTTMQRSVITSTIHYSTATVDKGEIQITKQEPVVVTGKVTKKNAIKYIKDKQPIITGIEYIQSLYTMELAKFLQMADLESVQPIDLDDKEEE